MSRGGEVVYYTSIYCTVEPRMGAGVVVVVVARGALRASYGRAPPPPAPSAPPAHATSTPQSYPAAALGLRAGGCTSTHGRSSTTTRSATLPPPACLLLVYCTVYY